jgi:hypothetical protein
MATPVTPGGGLGPASLDPTAWLPSSIPAPFAAVDKTPTHGIQRIPPEELAAHRDISRHAER